MKTFKFIIATGFMASVLMVSCSRDEQISSPSDNPILKIATALELKTFINQEVDGYLCIKSQNGLLNEADIGGSGSYRMGGHIYIDKEGVPQDAGTVEIDGISLVAEGTRDNMYGLWDHSQALNSMGKNVDFKLTDAANMERFNESMYIPEDIYFSCFDETTTTIDDGFVLTWNSDPSNTLGVGIIIRYLDSDATDPAESANVSNAVLSDDNGSYTLTVEDFADIPSGSLVKISVVRGNYHTATDLQDPARQYGLFAHLSATAFLTYEDL